MFCAKCNKVISVTDKECPNCKTQLNSSTRLFNPLPKKKVENIPQTTRNFIRDELDQEATILTADMLPPCLAQDFSEELDDHSRINKTQKVCNSMIVIIVFVIVVLLLIVWLIK